MTEISDARTQVAHFQSVGVSLISEAAKDLLFVLKKSPEAEPLVSRILRWANRSNRPECLWVAFNDIWGPPLGVEDVDIPISLFKSLADFIQKCGSGYYITWVEPTFVENSAGGMDIVNTGSTKDQPYSVPLVRLVSPGKILGGEFHREIGPLVEMMDLYERKLRIEYEKDGCWP